MLDQLIKLWTNLEYLRSFSFPSLSLFSCSLSQDEQSGGGGGGAGESYTYYPGGKSWGCHFIFDEYWITIYVKSMNILNILD